MTSGKRETQFQDDGDLKKYRTETPNLIYELRLTPYECALYNHFKRVAGAGPHGQCYRSTERLAEETGMSPGMISKAKKGLLRTDRPGLNGKALVCIEKDESRPGRPRDIVTIIDIWPENFLFFARQSSPQSSYSELQSSPQSSYSELQSSPQSSPGEPKNKSESLKNEPSKEKQQQPLLPPQLPFDEAGPEETDAADEAGPEETDAAAAGSLRLEDLEPEKPSSEEVSPEEVSPEEVSPEEVSPEEVSPEECDARRVLACSLHDLGVRYAEAEALIEEFPLLAIQQQIDWLPYQNCQNPGYWLPRYIREGWQKPRGLARQEAEAAKQQEREKSGRTVGQERNQERQEREAQAERRRVYRAGLDEPQETALLEEATAALLETSFWRDYVREHGTEKRSYLQALSATVDRIVDSQLSAEMALLESPRCRAPSYQDTG